MGKVSKALNKSQPQFSPEALPVDHTDQDRYNDQKFPHMIRENKVNTLNPNAPDLSRTVEDKIKNWDERLISSTRYVTGVAEGIRKLRSRILHTDSSRKIKSILILSSDPQEGKTFVCANLGISFARSREHQVLLVDCDLRRPSLHTMFGINREKGLADYLGGKINISGISDLEVSTGLSKLSIIPAGSPQENPAELLSSTKMPEIVDELSSRYHDGLVILDTPPFHSAAETLLLSKLVDKIVLVVRWGKSGRENIKKMVDTIGREKIIGTVFNAFEANVLDRKMQGVGYGNYYSEYY
ncbi:polysaccharide biosynthesis tyrosine autokinase [Desulfopila inferna]|uniref:polysaccharide biosynthesis tyrosine autokinase n=1 Tax=Desulfopila inferna TaxID=468528 RepID=UPI001966B4ED|nr:polysaccharide biosynthesis tyrosine autokinase [Desulfopila inferna]